MKRILTVSAISFSAGLATASCPNSPDVRYAVEYLAALQGPTGLLGPVGTVTTSDEICSQLKSYSVLQSKYDGYREVVLNLDSQTCTLQLKVSDHGKYSDVLLEGCEK